VRRVAEEEKRDGDRVGIDGRQRVESERLELAVGADPSLHADAALERDEGSWMFRAGPVQVRSRLAAEVEDVLEARFVTSAVRAPRRSSSAFVAMVVPS
jgi:hypothetical protein